MAKVIRTEPPPICPKCGAKMRLLKPDPRPASMTQFTPFWDCVNHQCTGMLPVEWVSLTENQQALLSFIRGEMLYCLGPGITTYPGDADDRTRLLHEGCLELEEMGLIHRHFEEPGIVVWMPVEGLDNE